MHDTIGQWLAGHHVPETFAAFAQAGITLSLLALICFLAWWVGRRLLIPLLDRAVRRSSNQLDDAFAERHFFSRLAVLLPAVAMYFAADLIFAPESALGELVKRGAMVLFVLASIRLLDAFLLALQDMYATLNIAQAKPIRGYVQAFKIILYFLGGIFIISIITDKSPWGVITIFGGLTAVLLLVFKDTILGFVAGIQLAANDMIRVGDWIEVPKHGADGDVIDVSIHTVKVRNWDKTITTIPTYKLVSDDFKNWRGMKESGGRRIKRAVHIDMSSIAFCTDDMLARFSNIALLKGYLTDKEHEIAEHNRMTGIDPGSHILNGRRQTNIGVFRAYVVAYLKTHPKIHQNMTFLVRHLQPTSKGLPLEIYVFSNDQVWANYEAIQADIFDHILAAVPEFGLRIFQEPSGSDFRGLVGTAADGSQ